MKRILLLLLLRHGPAVLAAKPNRVFVLADVCTFRDIDCRGGQAKTPNIDRLTTQGMRFTRCFQATPLCLPTRHNIYTGLYPVKSGAWPNHTRACPYVKSNAHHLRLPGCRVTRTDKVKAGAVSDAMVEYVDVTPTFIGVDGGRPSAPLGGHSFLPVPRGGGVALTRRPTRWS